jgi:hypothetical protein
VEMLVIFNEGTQLHDPIDRIRPRSVAFITGRNASVNAALNSLRSLEAGYQSVSNFTVAESDAVWEKYGEDIERFVSRVPAGRLHGGFLAGCVWAYPVDSATVISFAKKVVTGEMIQRGDPAFAYRHWRDANGRVNSWELSMATLNCVRHSIAGNTMMRSVYIGESGYRAITTKRRALKVPNTPGPMLVPTEAIGVGRESEES